MSEEELLLHFGVKGMKWGVRRARNSVGSVTRNIKDYAKVSGTTTKNSFKNPIASEKASRQLMKERPKTALYRNKDDLKRLNQLTAENVAAKKERTEKRKEKIKNALKKPSAFIEKEAQKNAKRYIEKVNKKKLKPEYRDIDGDIFKVY